MDLIIVRHGIAEEGLGGSDFSRALTVDGRKGIERLSAFLKTHFGAVDLIVSSPLVRAVETASILSEGLADPTMLELDELHHSTGSSETIEALSRVSGDIKSMIAVGHEPNLSSLISLALSGNSRSFVDVSRGSATHIQFQGKIGPGKGILKFVLRNKMLAG